MADFILSCESTTDFTYAHAKERGIEMLFYAYTVDGVDYPDDCGRDPGEKKRFYDFIAAGKIPKTTQLNVFQYTQYFESLLQKGDVLHINFSSGMTAAIQNAVLAQEELSEKYPDRKLIVIDSLCSSSGYGMLVDYCADQRDSGKSIDEVADYARSIANRIHHEFYSVDLQYYKRTGRMSGPAATLATILNIVPILTLNAEGRIIAYDKVRGKQAAVKRLIHEMTEHAVDHENYSGRCYLCHSERYTDACELKEALLSAFPNVKDIPIYDIGTIIASHCGPGTVAVFFLGDERKA